MWVSVFGYLRTLTTWHCPHSSAACRCCSNQSISPTRRAHSSEPAALWDRQTDGHRTVSLTLLRIRRRQCRRMPEIVGARSADGINVQKIITNVNNRVYYGKNNERQQTLMINVDVFFKRFVNFVLNTFAVRAYSKFQLVPPAAVGEIHSQTVTTKYTQRKHNF